MNKVFNFKIIAEEFIKLYTNIFYIFFFNNFFYLPLVVWLFVLDPKQGLVVVVRY